MEIRMSTPLIYMDHHATTPVAPEVFQAMQPYFTTDFGNAASKTHVFGWKAEAAVEVGREQVAALLGIAPESLIFTSGATESNNLALFGVARALKERGNHLITVATEHNSILDPCRALEEEGFRVTYLPVNSKGHLDLNALKDSLTPQTLLVSVMAANNEIGTLAPMKEIAAMTREAGVLLHSDAAQAVGKVPLPVEEWGVDLMSFTAHKFYGPKGIGALYVALRRPAIPLKPLIWGGGHERGMRSGTLNVPGMVGMGRAAQLAQDALEAAGKRVAKLRDELWQGLQNKIPHISINGDTEQRLPGNLNICFQGVPSEKLLMALKEIALSAGSACTSDKPQPSHVLKALGMDDAAVRSSIRFGLGRTNTAEEVAYTVNRVAEAVAEIRAQEGIDF